MGSLPAVEHLPISSNHLSMLQEVVQSSSVANFLIRNYERTFNGFAAKLTNQEAKKLASMKGVVSVFPSRTLHLLTTRSWDFMGFHENSNHNLAAESEVIIGVLDTGIWPESASFQDEGFGPPPKKWKGVCKGGKNFTCNNKIIGARFYSSSSSSNSTDGTARDVEGHGSHTASTAAGNKVKDASFFGLGQGTARGAVPSARIAAYKVCHPEGCDSMDILAAFDDAIADGVDIITVSLGGESAVDFYEDTIAIGAFHAMEKGILTLNSAGNNGLSGLQSVSSVAPWMVSVAASSTDRQFIDKVILGDGEKLNGFSVNSFNLNGTKFPLMYGKYVSKNCSETEAMLCEEDCLDSSLVEGKIVLCDQFKGSFEAHRAGAAGSILLNEDFKNLSSMVSLPALALSNDNYDFVKSYVKSTKKPEAEILKSEVIKDSAAPVVAIFSSRGPNFIIPDILKPDLTAPGVNILAAYSPLGSPSNDPTDKRQVEYNIVSGTSMSCPHAAGIAAYVKTFHSDWSPSAIQSALMTTARAMDQSKNDDGEFAYGSGHINPIKAVDPGLVYEAFKEDYIKLMCSIGYAPDSIRAISGDNSSCPESSQNVPPKDLNYPSMTAFVPSEKSFTVNFHRTVTNVGLSNSTYRAEVSPSSRLHVKVVPEVLSFKSLKEKKSFDVTVTGEGLNSSAMVSASLVWSDGNHTVRNPIVIHTFRGTRD
ncbi:subtilisin-like protease SBT4.3 [Durio zibethinus]|uniref:Subtilisin-like protease SBT4.3 n=1 Tax=Durio zibethinus TaxID=66656 RepID=A0A6P5WEQ3_DURZI|nr:subtilisin-like protease SBT4.3 [Durio zibethinus]